MGNIRSALKERGAQKSQSAGHVPDPFARTFTPSAELRLPRLILTPEFKPNVERRYRLNYLLKFHDDVFVVNAYRAIMMREPDEAGYRTNLEQLRNGQLNKIDILAGLRYSREGREKNVLIEGLAFQAALRQISRLPVIGYLFQIVTGIVRLPNSIRNQRQFETFSLSRQQSIANHINETNSLLAESLTDVMALAQMLSSQAADQQQQSDSIIAQLDSTVAAWQEQTKSFQTQGAQMLDHIRVVKDEIFAGHRESQEQIRILAQTLTQLVEERVNHLSARQQQITAQFALHERRIIDLSDKRRPNASAPQVVVPEDKEKGKLLDTLAALLEDRFRGNRQDIKKRLRVYIPVVKSANISDNILDLGCGRGEWLEVLKEEGFESHGVDSNPMMIEECRRRGLEVSEADAVSYLRGLNDHTLQAITGFHLIEHLKFDTLVALIDEAVRTLKPGGLVVFETPNPENVLVGSCNFYLDPSHQHPLPPEMMRFLLTSRGLDRVEIIRLHPIESDRILEDTEVSKRFNELFYGPMDYALTGIKV